MSANAGHTSRTKAKWGKLFNKDDSKKNFKLNEDVVDFLKPSTEKERIPGCGLGAATGEGTRQQQVPRLDTGGLQKWPSAGEVLKAAGAAEQPRPPSSRPRKKKGLSVGFAKTPPLVIGEGGDESEVPSIEISRMKARAQRRSMQYRRPVALDTDAAEAHRHSKDYPMSAPPRDPNAVPDMVQRSRTSAGENSYAHGRAYRHTPQDEPAVHPPPPPVHIEQAYDDFDPRPGPLKRTATGFSTFEEVSPDSPSESTPSSPVSPVLVAETASSSDTAHGGVLSAATEPSASDPAQNQLLPGLYMPKSRKGSPLSQLQQQRRQEEARAFRRISRGDFDPNADYTRPWSPESPLLSHDGEEHPESAPSSHTQFSRPGAFPAQLYPETAQAPSSPDIPKKESPLSLENIRQQLRSSLGSDPASPPPPAPPAHAPNRSPVAKLLPEIPTSPIVFPEPEYPSVQDHDTDHASVHSRDPDQTRVHQQHGLPRQQESRPAGPRADSSLRINPSYGHPRADPNAQSLGADGSLLSPLADRRTTNSSGVDAMFADAPSVAQGHTRAQSNAKPYSPHLDSRPSISNNPPAYPAAAEAGKALSTQFDSRPIFSNNDRPLADPNLPQARSRANSHVNIRTPSPQTRARSHTTVRAPTSSATAMATTPSTLFPPGQNNLSRPPMTTGRSFGVTPSPGAASAVTTDNGPNSGYFPPQSPTKAVSQSLSQPMSPQMDSPSQNFSGFSMKAAMSPGVSYEMNHHSRPSSQQSNYRPMTPDGSHTSSPDQAVYEDFCTRVAHMKGVFRLTAEKEQATTNVTPSQWLRTAIWWLHKGRSGLSTVVRNAPRGPDGQKREMLTQPHVDVAKTWWIVTEVLDDAGSPRNSPASPPPSSKIKRDADVVRNNLRSLVVSMQKNGVMPPHQSLIQGQDTTICVSYPRFAPDIAVLLRGRTTKHAAEGGDPEESSALDALPAGDTRDTFCYNRMFVNASINTEDVYNDRVILPCILTVLRRKSDYQTSILISSQNDLINLWVRPGDGGYGKGTTWHDVSWKARNHGIYIHLPRGFTMNVELQEADFRSLWNTVEYTRNAETTLKPATNESLIIEAPLTEMQYTDSGNPRAFPAGKVRSCNALVFEKSVLQTEGTGERRLHRGFRLVLITSSINKSLSVVTHELGKGAPLLFENHGNPAANEMPTMILHVQEEKRVCKATLVFNRPGERLAFNDALNFITPKEDEMVTAQAALKSLSIETTTQAPGSPLQYLRWQLGSVINARPTEAGQEQDSTVLSEHMRIVGVHEGGSVTDRLNLGPGELLLRLPVSNAPTLQLLRGPQEDLTISINTGKFNHQLAKDLTKLMHVITTTPTMRTLNFDSLHDVHQFQKALTRHTVKYDASASFLSITRRVMVVNIHKKLVATKVRLQVLQSGQITQIAAFFEDFSHADAMVFQIRSTDIFHKEKGDKNAQYCVKLVEAKFKLQGKEKEEGRDEESAAESRFWGKGIKRRFINLENLDYAEEHDDITIGFENEDDRDKFCEALPAATTTKKFDLRRKI